MRMPTLGAVCVCVALASASAAQAALAVYVANQSEQKVLQFGSLSGALSPLSPASVALPGTFTPTAVALSPDGRSAYVVGPNPIDADTWMSDYEIFQYDVAADGTPTPKTPASVALPLQDAATDVVVTPDGKYVYVASDQGVEGYAVGVAGTLSFVGSTGWRWRRAAKQLGDLRRRADADRRRVCRLHRRHTALGAGSVHDRGRRVADARAPAVRPPADRRRGDHP